MFYARWLCRADQGAPSPPNAKQPSTSTRSPGRHNWTDPQGPERAQTIRELQETAGPFPHLLAEHAGICLGGARHATETEAQRLLIAAQLCIEAGADLADVERWIPEGEDRARPKIMEQHGYEEAHRHERERWERERRTAG